MDRKPDDRDIVVTIDTSAYAPPAIALAAALARARQQALHGMFLEDEDLITVARLPFSRELGRVSGQARALNDLQLARAMARHAEEFRAALQREAQQLALSWSYSTLKGNRWRVVLAEVPAADILIIAAPTAQARPDRERILVMDWEQPGVLKALANVLDTRNCHMEVLLAGEGDTGLPRELLKNYPDSSLRLLGKELPDTVFRTPALRPGLVLVSRKTDTARLELCLKMADCPILVAA
jgi:hypothetical protein